MNWQLYASLITNLAAAVAASQGSDQRAFAYINLAQRLVGAGTATDADLTALQERYAAAVAAGTPVTPEELQALADEIASTSAQIQSA